MAEPLWSSIYPMLPGKQNDLELMKSVPVFEGIPERGLSWIRSLSHIRHFKENEHIFRRGEPGVGMYIILEGSVEIYRQEQDHRHTVAVLNTGDFFGELALLDDMPRSASARARSYSRLMGFYRPDLSSVLARRPRLASLILLNVARLLGSRLVATNQELDRLERANGSA